jgi:cyclin B
MLKGISHGRTNRYTKGKMMTLSRRGTLLSTKHTMVPGICFHNKPTNKDTTSETTAAVQHVFSRELHDYFQQEENKYCVRNKYFFRYPKRAMKIRRHTIKWLIEVNDDFSLPREVIHLAVSMVDRCLDEQIMGTDSIQLLAATCYRLAAKYEEDLTYPCVEEMIDHCCYSYIYSEFLHMERYVLKKLHFRVSVPTAYSFLVHYLNVENENRDTSKFANSIVESMLKHHRLMKFPPSKIAAVAVFIARKRFATVKCWTVNLAFCSRYSDEEMHGFVTVIRQEYRIDRHLNLPSTTKFNKMKER